MQTMYDNIAYSKNTQLTQSISASDTQIYIEDASVLPPAPNYAMLGTEVDNAETVFYAAKANGLLSGCTRGIEGVAKAWAVGTIISRNFSNVDYDAMRANIRANSEFIDAITASPTELNALEGTTLTSVELNNLVGTTSAIQTQIDSLSILLSRIYRQPSTAYELNSIVETSVLSSDKYLVCVEAGTTDNNDIISADVGTLIADGSVKWLVCDKLDTNQVGTLSFDYVVRAGYLKADGSEVAKAAYPRLWRWISDNNLWLPSAAVGGETGLFLSDSESAPTFKLADFTDKVVQGAGSAGTAISAGLPNVVGEISANLYGNTNGSVFLSSSGAFSMSNSQSTQNVSSGTNTTSRYRTVKFSASNSNAIYGNSTTVQPPAITMIPVIKY